MKSLILYLLLIFPIVIFSQNLEIKITTDRNTVAINQPIKISIYTNQKGSIIENWPKDFQLTNTPSFSSKFRKNTQKGTIEQEHLITYIGSFSTNGRKTIGPFEINIDGNKKKSNTLEINVTNKGTAPTKNTHITDHQIIEHVTLNKTTIYEGESVHLMNYLTSDNPYGEIIIKKPLHLTGNSDNFQLPFTSNWQEIDIDGIVNWKFPINSILIYPLTSDDFKIEPSEIIYSNVLGNKFVKTAMPTLKIKPLPPLAPNSFFGAVGKFEIKQSSTNKNLRQGDVVPLELIISGVGNFHQFITPKFKLPNGVELYGEPTISESFQYTENGTIGQIIYKYNLQIFEIGNLTIPAIPFTYFDLKEEKYVTIKDSSNLVFNILSNADYQRDYTKSILLNKKENIAPFTTIEPIEQTTYIIQNPIYWLFLIGLPLLTFTCLIISRKENVFLEERFKRLKRKPNHIKKELQKLSAKKEALTPEDLKEVTNLISMMLNKRKHQVIANNENLLSLLSDPNISKKEDQAIMNELKQIVELILKNLYAFQDPNSTKEIIDNLKKIALKWKQI